MMNDVYASAELAAQFDHQGYRFIFGCARPSFQESFITRAGYLRNGGTTGCLNWSGKLRMNDQYRAQTSQFGHCLAQILFRYIRELIDTGMDQKTFETHDAHV